MKRALSTKSVRSMKSMKSLKSGIESVHDVKLMDISEHLTNACVKFNCKYKIVVLKELQRDDYCKAVKKPEPGVKYKKIHMATSVVNQHSPVEDSDTQFAGTSTDGEQPLLDENSIAVTAIHDNVHRLVELSLSNVKEVPRILMQIIGLLVPYFKQLRRITMKNSVINKYTLYELHKMLPLSTITEICLDGSPLPEGNFVVLLEGQTCVQNLSLSRCLINDDVCKQIFARLHFTEPCERTLAILNLSSNHITDMGVKYIGEALRTNRHLRYLNLADNRIGDDGASHLFRVLTEFPLTYNEILDKRCRYFDYLKTKQALLTKCLQDYDSKSVDEYSYMNIKKTANKKKGKTPVPVKQKSGKVPSRASSFTDDYMLIRAEMMADEMMGPFVDPYNYSHVKLKDSHSHCIGNFKLSYINLSYNNLSYVSLKKLLAVVNYQQMIKAKSGYSGILKVLIEGNCMPVACAELVALNDILQRNIGGVSTRSNADKSTRIQRKSMRISVVPDK